jgi:hypothetical protein
MVPIDQQGFIGAQIKNIIDVNRLNFAEYFSVAEQINRVCHEVQSKINANDIKEQEAVVATLYIRSMHAFQSIIILAERGLDSGSKTLLRNLLETVFHLCASVIDTKYAEDFLNQDHFQRLKLLNKLKHNPRIRKQLKDFPSEEEMENEIQTLKDEIKENSIQKISIEDSARRAGLHDFYIVQYSLLSGDTHSSPRSIESYLGFGDKGKSNYFAWGPDSADIELILSQAITFLIIALRGVDRFYDLSIEKKIVIFEKQNLKLMGVDPQSERG